MTKIIAAIILCILLAITGYVYLTYGDIGVEIIALVWTFFISIGTAIVVVGRHLLGLDE